MGTGSAARGPSVSNVLLREMIPDTFPLLVRRADHLRIYIGSTAASNFEIGSTQARSAKPLINESRYTYIVELAVPDTGLEIELNRQIVSFHRSRRIEPQYGRRFTGTIKCIRGGAFPIWLRLALSSNNLAENFYHQ